MRHHRNPSLPPVLHLPRTRPTLRGTTVRLLPRRPLRRTMLPLRQTQPPHNSNPMASAASLLESAPAVLPRRPLRLPPKLNRKQRRKTRRHLAMPDGNNHPPPTCQPLLHKTLPLKILRRNPARHQCPPRQCPTDPESITPARHNPQPATGLRKFATISKPPCALPKPS